MWHDYFNEYFSFRSQFNEDCPNARYIPKRSKTIKNKRKNKRRKKHRQVKVKR